MGIEQGDQNLDHTNNNNSNKSTQEIFSTLKNLEGAENMGSSLNSAQQKLTTLYNSKNSIPDEVIISFVKGLESYKNKGGTIIFTGGFDYDLMDIKSGELTDIAIENNQVKVKFMIEDNEYIDEVALADTFSPDFSFYCK